MIVRRFLVWVKDAPVAARAAATSSLARSYLEWRLDEAERPEAEAALMLMLDDPAQEVHEALAFALADHPDAPRTVIAGLLAECSEIASVIVSRSPLLDEVELIHLAATGDARLQCAIALRAGLPAPVAAALAEVGELECHLALLRNPGIDVPDMALRRMIERFGHSGVLRHALIERPGLSLEIRQALLTSCTRNASLAAGGASLGEDAVERATLALVASASLHELQPLALHLRHSGQLTARLVLRCLLHGQLDFAAVMLSELSGIGADRSRALLGNGRSSGFAALYRRAGLPQTLFSVFTECLAIRAELVHLEPELDGPGLIRLVAERLRAVCGDGRNAALAGVQIMLSRLETEAAREEARTFGRMLVDDVHPAPLQLLELSDSVDAPPARRSAA